MRFALLLLVGCESASPPPPPTPPTPPTPPPKPPDTSKAKFVVEVGKQLEWYAVDTTLHKIRSLALPAKIRELEFVGRDPVLQFFDDDRIGVITPAGLELIAPPADSIFTGPKPFDNAEPINPPGTPRMFTKNGEIWLSRCVWEDPGGYMPTCAATVDARIRPLPVITAPGHAPSPYDAPPLLVPTPPIAPSTAIKATLVPDKERHQGKRPKLVCTDNNKTIEDPPAGSPLEQQFDVFSERGRTDLVWLSTDPPIFQLADHDNCRPCPKAVIFERCVHSTRFDSFQPGPDGLLAFYSVDPKRPTDQYYSTRVLFRAGKELGSIEHVDTFAFIP